MPLGTRDDFGSERYAGVLYAGAHSGSSTSAEYLVQDAQELGYDFVVLPLRTGQREIAEEERNGLSHEDHGDHRDDGSVVPPMTPATYLHTMISGSVSNRIVGLVSETADCKQLLMEMEWAAHLTCQACIVPMHASLPVPFLAQTLSAFLHGSGATTSTWVRIRAERRARAPGGKDGTKSSWHAWNEIRMHCEHHRNLGLVLDVAAGDGLEDVAENLRDGLMGEPLKAVIVSSAHPQGDVVCEMALGRGLQVIVDARRDDGGYMTPEDLRAMRMRLSHVLHSRPVLDEEDILEMPYRDFLQAPLQPLQDNLESQTYETFERDSPKYVAYEEAVFQALREKNNIDGVVVDDGDDGDDGDGDADVEVCVVGAGRGPLVSAVLRASVRADQPVRVVAVEKNRNAIVHVMARSRAEGWDMGRVTIVHADMRRWTPTKRDKAGGSTTEPYLADILVSELLGSFGDNELSPECLDGAQRFLRPGGWSIPTSYASYLSPVTASKVWSEVAARDAAITVGSIKNLETPFVVRLYEYREIDAPQRMFEFSHPGAEGPAAASSPEHNDREASDVTFVNQKPYPVVCHGFAGYFTAALWGDVQLSIHPASHTEAMYSWFPIFFPVRTPFTVDAGAEVKMSMFRRSSSTKVWYEWAVQEPVALPIANPGGRSYYVGL